jgi:hypothetical protein
VSGSELNSAKDRLDSNTRLANIFLAGGAALAAAAAVEAFYTDWHDYRSKVFIAPSAQGAGATVAVAGSF